jgi:hypothetical protein
MTSRERSTSDKSFNRLKGTMHIAMGAFYLIIGFLLLYIKQFGTIELPSAVAYTLGTLTLLYGAFRILRGYNTFKNG